MPSTYPGALDVIASDKANATTSQDDHPAHHNLLADAVEATQAELGTDPAGTYATLKLRLAAIEENLGGRELPNGYAEITASFTTTGSPLYSAQPAAEVPGLVITPTVPASGIIRVEFWAASLQATGTGQKAAAIYEGATERAKHVGAASTAGVGVYAVRVLRGLTPGATPSFKAQVGRDAAGTAEVICFASATFPAFIRAVAG